MKVFIYKKPELYMEELEVEDVITVSVGDPIGGGGGYDPSAPGNEGREPDENPFDDGDIFQPAQLFGEADIQGTPNPIQDEMLPFDTEILGGNPIQEGLNAMVENIINHF